MSASAPHRTMLTRTRDSASFKRLPDPTLTDIRRHRKPCAVDFNRPHENRANQNMHGESLRPVCCCYPDHVDRPGPFGRPRGPQSDGFAGTGGARMRVSLMTTNAHASRSSATWLRSVRMTRGERTGALVGAAERWSGMSVGTNQDARDSVVAVCLGP